MDQVRRDIQVIFEQGAQALDVAFRPGKVAHLAIDWQTLYCNPRYSLSQQHMQRIQRERALSNEREHGIGD